MDNWIRCTDKDEDIVLSSRIRLARNIKNLPFPNKLDAEKAKELVSQVEEALYVNKQMEEEYTTFYLWQEDEINKRSFLEKHLISSSLIANEKKSAFIKDKNETISIMINEEDHLRLQCISGGLDLKGAYEAIDKIDNLLEEKLDFAFNEKLGYLTACPTNIGTGLRASVMIHLPGLSMEKEIDSVFNAAKQVGMTIRGIYGEGSTAEGNIYQISNQITLGVSEDEIINNLDAVIHQIINQEKLARKKISNKYKDELNDRIYRSLGILKSAVLLSLTECMNLLSYVRMGIEMGIIKDINKSTINELMVNASTASLQKMYNKILTEKDRDLKRAELVKSILL